MKQVVSLLFLFSFLSLQAQEHVEVIQKEFSFNQSNSENILLIDNIFGHIAVEGYEGNKIQVQVTKKITAKSGGSLDKGVEEIKLGVVQKDRVLALYMDHPCANTIPDDLSRDKLDDWHSYNWNNHQIAL